MKTVIEVNESSFENEVLKSSGPVLVDFWAEWCGPCKMLAPVLDEVAREQAGRVKIAKVNVDQNPELAARFGVQCIPTILYFTDGDIRHQTVGMVSKKAITTRLDELTGTTRNQEN